MKTCLPETTRCSSFDILYKGYNFNSQVGDRPSLCGYSASHRIVIVFCCEIYSLMEHGKGPKSHSEHLARNGVQKLYFFKTISLNWLITKYGYYPIKSIVLYLNHSWFFWKPFFFFNLRAFGICCKSKNHVLGFTLNNNSNKWLLPDVKKNGFRRTHNSTDLKIAKMSFKKPFLSDLIKNYCFQKKCCLWTPFPTKCIECDVNCLLKSKILVLIIPVQCPSCSQTYRHSWLI